MTLQYYSTHTDEAKNKLQVLCANCNWVKRENGREVGHGTSERSAIRSRVRAFLVESFDVIADIEQRISRICEGKLCGSDASLQTLRNWRLVLSPQKPIVATLLSKWEAQDYYGSSRKDVEAFLDEQSHVVSMAERHLYRGNAKKLVKES